MDKDFNRLLFCGSIKGTHEKYQGKDKRRTEGLHFLPKRAKRIRLKRILRRKLVVRGKKKVKFFL
jgi:hypothetical protein